MHRMAEMTRMLYMHHTRTDALASLKACTGHSSAGVRRQLLSLEPAGTLSLASACMLSKDWLTVPLLAGQIH